jgi:hypothetical protein
MRLDLENAGSKVADYAVDLPSYETFVGELARYDDERLRAIEGSNHAILSLNAAIGAIDDMLGSKPPSEIAVRLTQIEEHATTARDAIRDAVRTMGGKSK